LLEISVLSYVIKKIVKNLNNKNKIIFTIERNTHVFLNPKINFEQFSYWEIEIGMLKFFKN